MRKNHVQEWGIIMEKLAIKGGNPVRKNKISYGKQWIDKDDIEAVSKVLQSSYLTCGPEVSGLEEELCKYTGAKYAAAVSNGTAALHCACIAAGIGPGDEVITTPLTFAASANCTVYCGAVPVFADINPRTYNIDPASIQNNITNKTKAVIAVDFTGQIVEIEEIRKICDKYNLVFIEDAAHSIGSMYNGKKAGSLADITTFSFHPVKTITGGEGGAVLTNNEDYYNKTILARSHGITHNKNFMEESHDEPWYYEEISQGYNYRITDIQCALIRSQLHKIDRFIARRKEIVKRYNEAFSVFPEIILQEEIIQSDTCRHLYILHLNLDMLDCTRLEFFNALVEEGIQPQIHYIPVYWFPFYKSRGYKKGICRNAEKVYGEIMSIPLYPAMSDQDIEDVIHAVKKVLENYKK